MSEKNYKNADDLICKSKEEKEIDKLFDNCLSKIEKIIETRCKNGDKKCFINFCETSKGNSMIPYSIPIEKEHFDKIFQELYNNLTSRNFKETLKLLHIIYTLHVVNHQTMLNY